MSSRNGRCSGSWWHTTSQDPADWAPAGPSCCARLFLNPKEGPRSSAADAEPRLVPASLAP